MPNLLLTGVCNLNCPYCFAREQVEIGASEPGWEMSREELRTVLGYLDPRWDPVSLLGGEPTLHSRFVELVEEIAALGFDLKIFTNGTTAKLRQIRGVDDRALNIILNLNPPQFYSRRAWQEVEANCVHFGPRLRLSFNIDSAAFTWDFLRGAIEDWNLGRQVRLGIAQPTRGMSNTYLREEEMRPACVRIVRMAEDLATSGISIGFDCGFRACYFTEKERGILAECGTSFLFGCRPVLDIGADLTVWRCFPFSVSSGVRLSDFSSLGEIVDHFERQWAEESRLGNIATCPGCDLMELGSCRGGCLSRTLIRLEEGAAHA